VENASLGDEELIRRLVDQDVHALELLYSRYARPVYSLALRMLGDPELVEDVVQEVFLRVWRRADSYAPQRGRVLSWLLAITHHRAVDELRRRRAATPVVSSPSWGEGLEPLAALAEGTAPDPADQVGWAEQAAAVRRAVQALPAAQRQTIELAYYGGLSQSEIAALLHEPLGTVKTRIRLAMQKLRGVLAGEAQAGQMGR